MIDQEKECNLPEWLKLLIQIIIVVLIIYSVIYLLRALFSKNRTKYHGPRIFISHSWDYANDYKTLIKRFNYLGLVYYNHSIPEEKAIDKKTKKEIEEGIQNKIRGCSKVLVLGGYYANNFWIKKEVMIANKMGKKVIAIKPRGVIQVPSYLENRADEIVKFNARAIIKLIQ